jgi:hypothetical protein
MYLVHDRQLYKRFSTNSLNRRFYRRKRERKSTRRSTRRNNRERERPQRERTQKKGPQRRQPQRPLQGRFKTVSQARKMMRATLSMQREIRTAETEMHTRIAATIRRNT